MPKVNLGSVNTEKKFGAKLKAAIVENRLQHPKVAQGIGVAPRTLSNRYNNPSQMTLGEMKLFIRMTNMDKQAVIDYLYGGEK